LRKIIGYILADLKESSMARFVSRLITGLSSLIVALTLTSVSLQASEYSLKNQGLSQDLKDYSSFNYQHLGQSDRRLSYQLDGGGSALSMLEKSAGYQMLSGLKAFQPLFNEMHKKQDYQKFKQAFIDQDEIEKQADYNQEKQRLDNEISQLSVKLKKEKEVSKKQAINSDLEALYQQQRNIRKAIKASKRKNTRLVSLPTYDLNEIFNTAKNKAFFLVDAKSLYYVTPEVSKHTYHDLISQQTLSVKQYSYLLESKVDFNQPQSVRRIDKSLLITRYYQDTLLAFSFGSKTARLSHLKDDKLVQFSTLLKNTVLEPKRLAFKGETLTTKYVWADAGKQKILEVSYKETGKRKNLIQVKASAQTNVFDPKQRSTAIEKHIGVLAVTKSARLLELKKIQTINGKKDIGWDQDVRNGIIKLADETLFVNKEDYYGYEGLWYLASWMSTNGINEKKIFLINGTQPISLTARLSNTGQVEISKAGNTLYQFTLDPHGFVTRLYFSPSKQTLNLISKETKTTKSNKTKVKQYMKTNKIVLL